MNFALCFTNFGPYHIARLRALAVQLNDLGTRLIAYEVAGTEQKYPWRLKQSQEPFEWITLFPGHALETVSRSDCRTAILKALHRDRPEAVAAAGYVRPEALAAAQWARQHRLPAVLMSESQAIDRPHFWWKELIKQRRVRLFHAALVGGPAHRDYLVQLGMPEDRVVLGYNAVDNDFFASSAEINRQQWIRSAEVPVVPYFLAVSRFVPEKNLIRLIHAFARYYMASGAEDAWNLVICGDGPLASEIEQAIRQTRCEHAIHLPGFLQYGELPRWYAHAGAFVLPSISEPWGLVVNEAAASGLPLLVSIRAGCATTLVPEPNGTSGTRFNPLDIEEMTSKLHGWPRCATRIELQWAVRSSNRV